MGKPSTAVPLWIYLETTTRPKLERVSERAALRARAALCNSTSPSMMPPRCMHKRKKAKWAFFVSRVLGPDPDKQTRPIRPGRRDNGSNHASKQRTVLVKALRRRLCWQRKLAEPTPPMTQRARAKPRALLPACGIRLFCIPH
jgi:hypothetical protein